MPPTISKVGPGKEYTTLAAWWDQRRTSGNADEWAECYRGDVGAVYLDGITTQPNANHYVRIYAATDHRHDGLDETNGAYITGGTTSVHIPFTRVEGLAISPPPGGYDGIVVWPGGSHTTLDGLLIVGQAIVPDNQSSGFGVYVYGFGAGTTLADVAVRNCIFRGSFYVAVKARAQNDNNGTVSVEVVVQNCTVVTSLNLPDFEQEAFGFQCAADAVPLATATATVVCTNCTATVESNYESTDFAALEEGGDGSASLTCNNCASSDDTADDFGGANNLVNQDPNELFLDPATGDLRLKVSSALNLAGVNLHDHVTTDIMGRPRHPEAPWEIGAFAHVCTAYYRLDEDSDDPNVRLIAIDQVRGYNLVAIDDTPENYPGDMNGVSVSTGTSRTYRGRTVNGFRRGEFGGPQAEQCFHLGSGYTAFGWFKIKYPGQTPTYPFNNWGCVVFAATNWIITAAGDGDHNGEHLDHFMLQVDSNTMIVYFDDPEEEKKYSLPDPVNQYHWTFLAAWIDVGAGTMGFHINDKPFVQDLTSPPEGYDPNNFYISLLSNRWAGADTFTNAADEWGFADRVLTEDELKYIYNDGAGRQIF